MDFLKLCIETIMNEHSVLILRSFVLGLVLVVALVTFSLYSPDIMKFSLLVSAELLLFANINSEIYLMALISSISFHTFWVF